MSSSFEPDELLRFAASYLSTLRHLSSDAQNNMISSVRNILAVASLVTPKDELTDNIYAALNGNISHKGIAEHLFNEDLSFSGEILRHAYNHYKNAVSSDSAYGIDFSIDTDTPKGCRTTVNIIRNGTFVDFIDIYTDDRPDTSDLERFFNRMSELLEDDKDTIPISSYLTLSAVIKDIDTLEREYVLKK